MTLPWRVVIERAPAGDTVMYIVDAKNQVIAHRPDDHEERRAAFDHIVRCVNMHRDLLDSCELLVQQFGEGFALCASEQAAINFARAAILKATGEQS